MVQVHKAVSSPEDLLGIEAPEVKGLIETVEAPRAAEPKPATSKPTRVQREPKPNALDGRNTRILLSTMKAYSPLISAITYTPGANATSEEAGEAISEMMAVVDRVGRAVEVACEVDRSDPAQAWAVGKIASSVAVHVGRQWRYISEGAAINEEALASSIARILNSDLPQVEEDFYIKPGDDTSVKLAMLRTLAPIMVEARVLTDYMRDARLSKRLQYSEDELLARASDDVFKASADMVAMLNPNGNEVDRLIMLQSCLNQSGYLYASAMAHAIDELMVTLGDAADNGTLQDALSQVPTTFGINMDEVYESFEISVMRLAGIASRYGFEEKKPAPGR